jgi:hypothetical protein
MTPPPPLSKVGRDAHAELLCEVAPLLHRANSQYSMPKCNRNRAAPASARDMRAESRGVATSSPPRVVAGIQKSQSRTFGLKAELNTHTRIALALHAMRIVLPPAPHACMRHAQSYAGFKHPRHDGLA